MPNPAWFDPSMPSRDACVLRHLLDLNAARFPERGFASFEDGQSWSYAQALRLARNGAAALKGLGVKRGDLVSVWLPNGAAAMRAWLAINYLGAVFAPINTAYRGRLLEHVLRTTGASILICHADLFSRLDGADCGAVSRAIICGGQKGVLPGGLSGLKILAEAVLDGDGAGFEDPEPLEPWDIYAVIYTSGTTGPSKGVLQTYLQVWTAASCSYGYMGSDDRMLINLPLFHVGGVCSAYAVMSAGASFAMFQGFSTARFWDEIREAKATTTSGLIGSMADFLLKAPPRDDDGDNPLRMLTMGPVNDTTVALARRFKFDWLTGFNMTEVSVPLVTSVNSTVPYCCGRPRTGIEARVVDINDLELPRGKVGELILRSDLPWTMTPGYLGMPEATLAAWRNGWFHTGDAFRQDEDGNFFFVDRLKDAIRRRGENVSSAEVEGEAMSFASVLEAAAVAVPSGHGEDEILLCVAARPGQAVEPAALVEFLRGRMAHFMVPRYIRCMAGLPRTPTNKVQKAELRQAGLTSDTFDREAAGVVLKRERFRN